MLRKTEDVAPASPCLGLGISEVPPRVCKRTTVTGWGMSVRLLGQEREVGLVPFPTPYSLPSRQTRSSPGTQPYPSQDHQ